MRLSDESAAPRKHNTDRADEREAIGAEIAAMLEGDPETQGQFLAALHAATVFMPGRERTKTNAIKLVQELRVRYNEFGRRRVADGTFHKTERLRSAQLATNSSRRSTTRASSRRCSPSVRR